MHQEHELTNRCVAIHKKHETPSAAQHTTHNAHRRTNGTPIKTATTAAAAATATPTTTTTAAATATESATPAATAT
eukprot:13492075-Alexandrium_andersonii.AAC.1